MTFEYAPNMMIVKVHPHQELFYFSDSSSNAWWGNCCVANDEKSTCAHYLAHI